MSRLDRKGTCLSCKKSFEYKLKKCGNCLIARYCERSCQCDDWSRHCLECGECEAFYFQTLRMSMKTRLDKNQIHLMKDIGDGIKLKMNVRGVADEILSIGARVHSLVKLLKNYEDRVEKHALRSTKLSSMKHNIYSEVSTSLRKIIGAYARLDQMFKNLPKERETTLFCKNFTIVVRFFALDNTNQIINGPYNSDDLLIKILPDFVVSIKTLPINEESKINAFNDASILALQETLELVFL